MFPAGAPAADLLAIDGRESEIFVGDDEANKMLRGEYRDGFEVEQFA